MNELCILQVEDDANDVFLLEHAFRATGITASRFVVNDGQEAVNYLSGNGKYANRDQFPLPSLIILDLKMPRMNGLQVLEWVRAESPQRSIPVIVLTSSPEDGDIDRAYALGANSFVVKPSSVEKRLQLIEHFKGYWIEFNKAPGVVGVAKTAAPNDTQ